ncbi:MAG: YaiI/YqxD family protein [Cyanobacteria bacterium]|nr:YaiI/YqxD family protein [Cyanobacteriota bacterium]
MKIWVDADACPVAVRDVVIAAARRRTVEVIFVANKPLSIPVSPLLSSLQSDLSPDAADRMIAERTNAGDIVITHDIPLAHILVKKEVVVISPRGELFSEENIGDRLSIRNLLQDMRDTGEITGGPKQFGEREKRAFAATFDRELTRALKRSQKST